MNEHGEVSSSLNEAVLINGDYICDFCGWATNDLLKYGPKYQLGNFRAHYYCVLLSKDLEQNGQDNEGIMGFLLKDIKRELKRCSRVKCIYCHNKSANIFCREKNCKRSFHLPCGLKKGCLLEFKDCYNSYCHSHSKFQLIPRKIFKEAEANKIVCCICYDSVPLRNRMKYIWAPCCKKTWYHKKCLQKLAWSAGYFFRCAACNNSTEFINCVLELGVFIPQQDASWELVPNAFSELLFTYNQCDAELCNCPDGRRGKPENTMWDVILCKFCGSQGIHIGCRSSNCNSLDWECPSCQKVMEKFNFKNQEKLNEDGTAVQDQLRSSTQEIFSKKRIRATEDFESYILDKRKKCKTETEDDDDDDDDEEIDVVTVEKSTTENKTEGVRNGCNEVIEVKKANIRQDFDEALASIRPGPLCFKLRMINNYWHLEESSEKAKGEIKDLRLKTTNT